MQNAATFFWRIILTILFRCAAIFFTVTRKRVCGSLVAVWSRGNLLLVKKSYRKAWSLPGGLRKKGESWEQAAIRELFEEVGIRLKEEALSFVTEVAGDLGPGDRARIFQAQTEDRPAIRIDRREISAAEFVAPEEALQRELERHVEKMLRDPGNVRLHRHP